MSRPQQLLDFTFVSFTLPFVHVPRQIVSAERPISNEGRPIHPRARWHKSERLVRLAKTRDVEQCHYHSVSRLVTPQREIAGWRSRDRTSRGRFSGSEARQDRRIKRACLPVISRLLLIRSSCLVSTLWPSRHAYNLRKANAIIAEAACSPWDVRSTILKKLRSNLASVRPSFEQPLAGKHKPSVNWFQA